MAVAYDNSASNLVAPGTSVAVTLTIGSGSNRAAACLIFLGNAISNPSVTGAGTTWTLVANTTANSGGATTQIYVAAAPASGSQTVTVSWTTSAVCIVSVIAASGVDQTTPLISGATAVYGSSIASI